MIDHGYARNGKPVALASTRAGVNMEMASPCYQNHSAELVSDGTVDVSTVDQMVVEIIRIKFTVGLFEEPSVEPGSPEMLLREYHNQLASRIARKSVVQLKNNEDFLPFEEGSIN